MWLHTKKYLPEMQAGAIDHWLNRISTNSRAVLPRLRRAIDTVLAAVQANQRYANAVMRLHRFPDPVKGAGCVTGFVKQMYKTEELWLQWALDEVAFALDGMMVGTCLDPNCGEHQIVKVTRPPPRSW